MKTVVFGILRSLETIILIFYQVGRVESLIQVDGNARQGSSTENSSCIIIGTNIFTLLKHKNIFFMVNNAGIFETPARHMNIFRWPQKRADRFFPPWPKLGYRVVWESVPSLGYCAWFCVTWASMEHMMIELVTLWIVWTECSGGNAMNCMIVGKFTVGVVSRWSWQLLTTYGVASWQLLSIYCVRN